MKNPVTDNIKERVVINTEALDWVQTNSQNITQKIIARTNNGSYERITSLVRYVAGAIYSPHSHPYGEEVLVLEGSISDEKGDFLTGSYIRNPPNSFHQPYSRYGCIIFTKLNQMSASEERTIYQGTQDRRWMPSVLKGIDTINLYSDISETVELVRYQAGLSIPHSHYQKGEEIFILEGQLQHKENLYLKGSWIRTYINSEGSFFSKTGCVFYRKTYHQHIKKEINS